MTYKNEPSFALIATKNAAAKNRKKRNPTTQPRDPTPAYFKQGLSQNNISRNLTNAEHRSKKTT
jgi:hypothetical protein